jgi:hypothetical protein
MMLRPPPLHDGSHKRSDAEAYYSDSSDGDLPADLQWYSQLTNLPAFRDSRCIVLAFFYSRPCKFTSRA